MTGIGDRSGGRSRFWVIPGLDGVECLQVWSLRQRFARHSHEAYAIGVIDRGVGGNHYRGSTIYSPAGSLAARHPEIIGEDLATADGTTLPGITKVPIVVLKAPTPEAPGQLSAKARGLGCTTLVYLTRAQGLRSYREYAESIAGSTTEQLDIDAFMAIGPKKQINRTTGNLPMVR